MVVGELVMLQQLQMEVARLHRERYNPRREAEVEVLDCRASWNQAKQQDLALQSALMQHPETEVGVPEAET